MADGLATVRAENRSRQILRHKKEGNSLRFEIKCVECGNVQPLLFTKNTERISVIGHAFIDNTDVFIECECGNETRLHIDHDKE